MVDCNRKIHNLALNSNLDDTRVSNPTFGNKDTSNRIETTRKEELVILRHQTYQEQYLGIHKTNCLIQSMKGLAIDELPVNTIVSADSSIDFQIPTSIGSQKDPSDHSRSKINLQSQLSWSKSLWVGSSSEQIRKSSSNLPEGLPQGELDKNLRPISVSVKDKEAVSIDELPVGTIVTVQAIKMYTFRHKTKYMIDGFLSSPKGKSLWIGSSSEQTRKSSSNLPEGLPQGKQTRKNSELVVPLVVSKEDKPPCGLTHFVRYMREQTLVDEKVETRDEDCKNKSSYELVLNPALPWRSGSTQSRTYQSYGINKSSKYYKSNKFLEDILDERYTSLVSAARRF